MKKQKGARAVNEYDEQIKAVVVQFRVDCNYKNVSYEDKTIEIDYDVQTDKIFHRCLKD